MSEDKQKRTCGECGLLGAETKVDPLFGGPYHRCGKPRAGDSRLWAHPEAPACPHFTPKEGKDD